MVDPSNLPERLTRSERINIRIAVTQTLLAVVGIFIGSVALYAALSESEEVRKQTEASVWPRVAIGHNRSELAGQEMLEFVVSNFGIGPAIINGAKVTIDGAPKDTWFAIIEGLTGEESPPIRNAGFANAIIPAGESVIALHMESEIARLLNASVRGGRIAVEICYCSVFDQCWLTRYNDAKATPVQACPEYGADAFKQ